MDVGVNRVIRLSEIAGIEQGPAHVFGIVVAAWEIKTQDPVRDSVLVFAGSLLGGPLALNTGQQALEALRSRGGTGGSSTSSPEAVAEPSGSS